MNQGEKHQQLEAALRGFLGAELVTLFTNGHLALDAVISAMEDVDRICEIIFN